MMRATPIYFLFLTMCVMIGVEASWGGELIGGGGTLRMKGACVSAADLEGVGGETGSSWRVDDSVFWSGLGGGPPLLTFFPMAGTLWGDLFTFNYVDLNPAVGVSSILDWDCTDWTYDGHNGNDTVLRSFGEQVIGVPVFAAQDGLVVDTNDGEFDMNTQCQGIGNYVIIDHGFGRIGYYWHFKKNSIVVSPGQLVRAGEALGLTGSSGCSTAPHLHFEIRDGGQVFEPFRGECRGGVEGWLDQTPIDRSMYLQDFGIAYQSITQGWPYEWPRTGQIALTDPVVRVWFYGTSLPAGSSYRVRFKRPDGAIVHDELRSFGNPFWRWFNWWWTYDVADMHSITGTWHVLLDLNGELMIEAPIEVRVSRTADFNSPPEPIGVSFDPERPVADGVQKCVVTTSLTLDDKDYDIVRYEYVWSVDGEEIRRVTTAAHSDVLLHHTISAGELLSCVVTPHDGTAAGPAAEASGVVGCSRSLDFACDGDVDLTDYAQFWECVTGPEGSVGGDCWAGDADGDGDVDLLDFGALLSRFRGDCGVRVTDHPLDAMVCIGESVALSVAVDGRNTVYEWRRNGVPVPGATGSTLAIGAVTEDSVGSYLVYVVGDCGFDYSRPADVSVFPPPEIVVGPESVSACLGEAVSFAVEAEGTPPLQFQWEHNGSIVPGATEATTTIDAITGSDLGEYSCVVTDGCGLTVVSATAELTLPLDPVIVSQPVGGSFCVGDTVFLFVAANGAETYQWTKDGVAIPGATTAFYVVSDATEDDSGAYKVVVGGVCTEVVSDSADVVVIDCQP